MERSEYAKGVYLLLSTSRRLLVICVIVFCVFIAGHSNVQAYSANSTCSASSLSCTARDQWDGAQRYAGGWGVSGIVGDYQVNYLCISSSAWTMIDYHSAKYGFAQSGYDRDQAWSKNITYYFYEYADANTVYPPVMLGAMTKNWGSSDTFVTYYNSGSGYIQMMINGVVEDYYHADWSANEQSWFSEDWSDADHIVGGYNHESVFANDQYLYNGVWYNINASNYSWNDSAYGTAYFPGGNKFYVWDTRVS